ncbi:hypothetical protein [Prosthecobacter sp.]|uniref:hypothetical protein n=1 Tax=Prosthecobacter sp. TaxID=1965333 RepID=UPI0025E3A915|nr:hypothetical protein [Prosthecobacter sp.]
MSNLTVAQRVTTRLIDINYDVQASGVGTVKIKLEVSADGGASSSVPVQTVSGDVGDNVAVGANKQITWDAGTDWPGHENSQMRFRVIADDLVIAGFSRI